MCRPPHDPQRNPNLVRLWITFDPGTKEDEFKYKANPWKVCRVENLVDDCGSLRPGARLTTNSAKNFLKSGYDVTAVLSHHWCGG